VNTLFFSTGQEIGWEERLFLCQVGCETLTPSVKHNIAF